MKKDSKEKTSLINIKFYLLAFLGFAILIGSGVLFWQIEKQTAGTSNNDEQALKNQIDDLNKKIDELNKAIAEAKAASPTVETRSYTQSSSGQVAGAKATRAENKININTASVSELDSLPGIGKSYADRIIAYREANGGFKSIEEIKNIKGIGDKTFEKFKDLISI